MLAFTGFEFLRCLANFAARARFFRTLDNRFLRVANDFLTQTGLRFNRNLAFLTGLALGAVYFCHTEPRVWIWPDEAGICGFIATAATAFLFLAAVRRKRIARFGEQLPDAIDVIVRGVRVGFPFSAAMDLVAREMADPVGAKSGIVSDEITFGLDIRTAIEHLYRRVGQEDLLFFVVAVTIQTETGVTLRKSSRAWRRSFARRSKLVSRSTPSPPKVGFLQLFYRWCRSFCLAS